VPTENIVAICDVDANHAANAAKDFPQAKVYADFRQMLDTQKNIDAVMVATPDHNHAVVTMMALKMGKHVFCQKPLTHSVWEARELARLAKVHNVPTMMGNQGTAESTLRKSAAILKGGHLGAIKEVHVVTNRPVWAQGGPRPEPQAPPKFLNWDAWLGPAPERPYAPDAYHAFSWRGWWDFGTGALGDMACHTFNMPFMGAGLKDPVSIQAWTSGHNRDSYPQKSKIKFEFLLSEGGPIVPVWWYDGKNEPNEALLNGQKFKRNNTNETTGSVIVCEKGVLYSHGDYSGSVRPEPSNSLGKSLNFGRLSRTCSTPSAYCTCNIPL
jgi:predicted dehydrogenase